MIDWISVIFHACWILGASILLAYYSYFQWETSQLSQGANIPPSSSRHKIAIKIAAFALGIIGLVGTSQTPIERIAWIALGVVLIISTFVGTSVTNSRK